MNDEFVVPGQNFCEGDNHNFVKNYYGTKCKNCDLFYSDGGAPWEYDEEREAEIAREEYYLTHGNCETCGGECSGTGIYRWCPDCGWRQLARSELS